MRIGLLTMVFNNNYGGLLQAYALQWILKDQGHQVVLINAQRRLPPFFKAPLTMLRRLYLNRVHRVKFDSFIPEWAFPGRIRRKEKNTRSFISEYIQPQTRMVFTNKGIKSAAQGFDAYVVGSDQVWRPDMYPFIESAFLGFVKGRKVKKLSYAASFGNAKWAFTEEQTRRFKQQILDFDGVSVREESGADLCRKHFKVDAVRVLDPTFLLGKEHYCSLIPKEEINSISPELFCYVLDESEEKRYVSGYLAGKLGLRADSFFVGKKDRGFVYPTVTSWLASFYNAKFVFTDSFHGCVFSILLNKPFFVFGNKIRGLDRFTSLLKIFQLEDRLILAPEQVSRLDPYSDIDWVMVNERLRQEVKASFGFLENIINH